MKSKIIDSINKGRYLEPVLARSFSSYQNKNDGWTDYLLGSRLIFSHKTSNLSPNDFPENLHAHDYYELTVCLSKDGMQYIADEQNIEVKKGVVILTKPMAIHMYRPLQEIEYDRYVLYFKRDLDLFSDSSVMDFLNSGNQTTVSFYFPGSNLPAVYLHNAEEQLKDIDSKHSSAKALLSIVELFLMLSSSGNHEASLFSPVPQFISKIKSFVDEEYMNIRSVSDLSDKFFYSREYITRAFTKYYNTPLYEYILRRKLLNCCMLLKEGSSVEKAAVCSGFRNMSSFTKDFKNFTGCTPLQYKQKNNK